MKSRLVLAGIVLTAAAALAACGPDNSNATPPSGSGSTTAGGGGGGTAAGRDACLTGAWKVDVQDLADQTAAKTGHGGTGQADGAITVTFGDSMGIDYDYTVTITSPASNGMAVGVKDVFAGKATSNDYQASNGKLTGTMASNNVTLATTVTVNGQGTAGAPKPLTGVLDLSKGITSYTCSGSTMTLQNGVTNWHLSKA